MYYSKSTSSTVSVPHNYSGNVFRVIDESDRSFQHANNVESEICDQHKALETECSERVIENKTENDSNAPSSIFSNISMEDILIIGLMLVIHQNDPQDPTALLLLILLLAK